MSTPNPGPLGHPQKPIPIALRRPLWAAIRRGLRRRCPACGQSRLFTGYLTLRASCPACGLETERYRADDAPAYFTIAIVGHIVVPLLLATERIYAPSTVIQLAVWLPVTLALTLWILPRAKGALVATNWATEAGG
jgi:uncharacterized protein (DUF983 family)